MDNIAIGDNQLFGDVWSWFEKRSVLAHSSAGTPYLRSVSFGMSTIPTRLIDTVVYLYPDAASANGNSVPGGTGFLVGVRFKTVDALLFHVYAITNHHVACSIGNSCIRVNKRGGGADVFQFSPDDWEFIPGLDLAAIAMPYNEQKYQTQFIPDVFFVGDNIVKRLQLNVGEDVFMIGSFVDNHGDAINTPAARFGNISLMPSVLEIDGAQPGVKYRGPYYCLDMRSRTGFSGSPVFYYRTPGSDLSKAGSSNLSLEPPVLGLLGAHAGQFPETIKLKDSDGKKSELSAPSGMTMAIPSQKILELLHVEKFVARRKVTEEKYIADHPIRKNSPTLESSSQKPLGDD